MLWRLQLKRWLALAEPRVYHLPLTPATGAKARFVQHRGFCKACYPTKTLTLDCYLARYQRVDLPLVIARFLQDLRRLGT